MTAGNPSGNPGQQSGILPLKPAFHFLKPARSSIISGLRGFGKYICPQRTGACPACVFCLQPFFKLLKMKRLLLSLLFAAGLYAIALSQNTGLATVSGTLADEQGAALPFATVTLHRSADSLLVKAGLSDEKGAYQIEIPIAEEGSFFVRVSLLGFQPAASPSFRLTPAQSVQKVATIRLLPSANTLGEATVTARKPFIERKTDRLVVNVENSIVSAGSSAFEVLERSPGVFINSSDAISLRGKAGVIIMIDGKPTPMSGQDLANMLRGMPSSNIERIEIITNPSAKYDAAGNAGIIDIRLKKDRRFGTNGTLSANYGQGIYPKYGAGLNLNHRNRYINAFGSYNYSYRKGFNKLDLVREFFENAAETGAYDQRNRLLFPFNYHSGRAGLDFYPDKKTVVGVVAGASVNRFDPNGLNKSDVLDAGGNKESAFTTRNDSHDRWPSWNLNANFKHSFDDEGKDLSADLDYMRFSNTTDQTFTTNYFDLNGENSLPTYILTGDLRGNLQIRSIKVDYSNPLKNKAKWEAGLKSSWVTADNDVQFFDKSDPAAPLFDSTKSNHFIYDENLNAAYLNAAKEWEKCNLQIGLRAEQTRAEGNQLVTGQRFDTTYLNLFPSAFFNYKISKNYETGLNLSRRLDRPSYQQLNPFKFFLDPSTYREGNPYLRPQFTWSFESVHTFFGKYTATLGYSRTTDNITQVIAPVDGLDRVTVQTDKNLARYDYLGLTINAPIDITKWCTSINDLNIYQGWYTGNLANTSLANGNAVFFINSNNSFRLPGGWSAELGGWYQSRQIYAFMDLDPLWSLNAGVQKQLFDRRATLRLNISDMFWTSPPSAVVTFRDYVEHFDVKRETRVLNLSVTWRFGSNEVAPSRRRTGGAEEERRRASNGQG